MANADTRRERPLSPHLMIYRPIITMVMSIMHRITGTALYAGTILLAWWLLALAIGPGYFETVNAIYGSFFGRFVLFCFTWALMHHMLGGIRHFIWDTGRGFESETREWLAWATLIGGGVLTVLLWIIGYIAR